MKNIEIKIVNLKNRLKQVASEETCHPLCKEDWSPANPLYGHCAVVTAIAYKKFGGTIMRGIIAESGFSHYWNNIDGVDYDLTKEQYANTIATIIDGEEVRIDRILNNEQTKYRYDLLLSKLEELPEEANDSNY